MKSSILDKRDNMFGSLKDRPDIKKKIYNYLDNPTAENWNEISTLIIDKKTFSTTWNAMIKYDSTFPRSGETTNENGEVIKPWSRIPTPFELMKAIQQF